ncbi:hypothetical protein [Vogesella oryzae]|uniref:hypothetical protein n=1 Tax=Vogesella oryzae TaxID=1735285 RepID=UPI001583F31E|nr:hypothetical protein [Vogesella oryzae]
MNDSPITAFSPLPDAVSTTADASSNCLMGNQVVELKWQWKENKSNSYQIGKRERITLTEQSLPDVAVMPGKAANRDAFLRHKEKELLLGLIQRFEKEGFTRTVGNEGKITVDTAKSAMAFLKVLPEGTVIPKIAPDGEGGLVVAWEGPQTVTILVVDDWRLHLVRNAKTKDAEYFDDILFDGEKVPDPVLMAIPTR